MGEKQESKQGVIQNLQDAGCNKAFIETFCQCEDAASIKQQLCLLSKQRCKLLAKIHAEQKKLDCLDYLIFKLKKIQQEQTKNK